MVKATNILNIILILIMIPIIALADVSRDLKNTAWILLLAIVVLTIGKFYLWPKKKKKI